MSDLWRVHVAGPDDILPATSRLDAMIQAHFLNAEVVRLLALADDDELYPTTWARPVPPGENP